MKKPSKISWKTLLLDLKRDEETDLMPIKEYSRANRSIIYLRKNKLGQWTMKKVNANEFKVTRIY